MGTNIEIIEGDITKQNVDVIVNAANNSLLGGGGVDGAIHRAAGPELLAETKTLGGCPTGEARVSEGYNLPAEWVIHTVGPVWRGGDNDEDNLLASCYKNSFAAAKKLGAKSIAFPSISTGVYGFPLERATRIALGIAKDIISSGAAFDRIIFVTFGNKAFNIYKNVYSEMFGDNNIRN